MNGSPDPKNTKRTGIWAAMAVSLGPVIGIAQDNLVLGIAGGIVIAAVIIIIVSLKRSNTQ